MPRCCWSPNSLRRLAAVVFFVFFVCTASESFSERHKTGPFQSGRQGPKGEGVTLPDLGPLPDDVFAPQVKGGQCVPLASVNSTGFAFDCKPYIPYDLIYVSEYFVQRQDNLRVLATPLPAECQRAMAQWLCLNYWRRCVKITASPNNEDQQDSPPSEAIVEDYALVGAYSCRNVCEKAREQCHEHSATKWPALEKDYLDCDDVHSGLFGTPTVKLFPRPSENYKYPLQTKNGVKFNATIPCSVAPQPHFLPTYEGPLVCPPSLNYELDGCVFGCPEPLLTSEQWDGLTALVSVTAWLSFFLMGFLCLSYLVDPRKRRFPANLPLFFFLCIMFFSFGLCISSMVGYKEVLCETDGEAAYWGNETCTLQGILIVYFMFAAMSWWLLIAFNLLAHLMSAHTQYELGIKKRKTVLMLAYHCFAWLFPLLPLTIALSAGRIGSNGATLWCGIHSATYETQIRFFTTPTGVQHNSGGEKRYWTFFLFLTPLSLMVILGMSMIGVVIGYQLKRQRKTFRAIWNYCRKEWRIVAFLGLYVWVCLFLAIFEISFLKERTQRNDNYQAYIDCLLVQQQTQLIGNDVTPIVTPLGPMNSSEGMSSPSSLIHDDGPCVLDRVTNFPLWVIASFNFVGHGLFVFLIFGTTKRIYQVWWRLCSCRALPGNTLSQTGDDGGSRSVAAAIAASTFSLEDTIVGEADEGERYKPKGTMDVLLEEMKPPSTHCNDTDVISSYDGFSCTSDSSSRCCCSSSEEDEEDIVQQVPMVQATPAKKPQPQPLGENEAEELAIEERAATDDDKATENEGMEEKPTSK
ncbi:Frizzled-9 [Balamuthia mandrillaris]